MEYVLANWKMYPTIDEARGLVETIQAGLRERVRAGAALPRVIICPPFVSLVPLRAVVDDQLVRLGAQNCHWSREGPYTGEISPEMLRGLVQYVLVGHSERRAMGETDEQIARKVAAVSRSGLVPILFVGEDERGGDAIGRTEQQLRQALSLIDVTSQPILVVYEPVWAIGVERPAPAEDVARAVEHIKAVLAETGRSQAEVLYGGSVAEDNIDALAHLEILDGVGATRTGLQPECFLGMIDRLGRARMKS